MAPINNTAPPPFSKKKGGGKKHLLNTATRELKVIQTHITLNLNQK